MVGQPLLPLIQPFNVMGQVGGMVRQHDWAYTALSAITCARGLP